MGCVWSPPLKQGLGQENPEQLEDKGLPRAPGGRYHVRPWEQAPENLWRQTRQRRALGQSCCCQAATHRAAVSVSLRKVLKVLATGEPQKQVVPELEPTCTERFFQVKGLRAQEQQEVAPAPGQLAQILAVHPTPLLAGGPQSSGALFPGPSSTPTDPSKVPRAGRGPCHRERGLLAQQSTARERSPAKGDSLEGAFRTDRAQAHRSLPPSSRTPSCRWRSRRTRLVQESSVCRRGRGGGWAAAGLPPAHSPHGARPRRRPGISSHSR